MKKEFERMWERNFAMAKEYFVAMLIGDDSSHSLKNQWINEFMKNLK